MYIYIYMYIYMYIYIYISSLHCCLSVNCYLYIGATRIQHVPIFRASANATDSDRISACARCVAWFWV